MSPLPPPKQPLSGSPVHLPPTPKPQDVRHDPAPIPPADLPGRPRRQRPFLREVLELAMLVVVILLVVRQLIMPFAVDGASMNPFLQDGEHLFVNRLSYADMNLTSWLNVLPGVDVGTGEVISFGAPKRGDIIVLNPPTESKSPYVKRVIALPGETVSFREGIVFVDGRPLTESYIDGAMTFCRTPVVARGSGGGGGGGPSWCALTVPEDSVYVLGDNRLHSSDSRAFGPVKISAIVGKVIFTNWPLDRFGPVPSPDYDDTVP